tara:strand:- start:5282 stop:5803 length:522 start_codon:yes stop_codon:yes gene_type:complete
MLQAHYRSVLDLSNDALLAAEKGYNKLIDSIDILENLKNFSDNSDFDIQEWVNNCYNAMNDDFNTPILIANLFEAVKFINKINLEKARISKNDWEILLRSVNSFVFDIMGLQKPEFDDKQNKRIDDVINILLELRNEARKNKDYKLSDRIRDMLKEKGISLNDSNKDSSYSID